MQQRLPSIVDPPILFAHRGARAHAPENTLEAFALALRLGASGLESDVWLTADGVAVLDHDGVVVRGRLRRKTPIAEIESDDLPPHIPSLAALVELCPDDRHLSLDLKDPAAGPVVVDTVRRLAPGLLPQTWLCDPDLDRLASLRRDDGVVRLVNSVRLHRIDEGPERRAARLAETGIDVINMRGPDWNGGLVALFHRFDVAAFSWDLQFPHELRPALRMGIDGVFSDFVDRMVDAARAEIGGRPDSPQ